MGDTESLGWKAAKQLGGTQPSPLAQSVSAELASLIDTNTQPKVKKPLSPALIQSTNDDTVAAEPDVRSKYFAHPEASKRKRGDEDTILGESRNPATKETKRTRKHAPTRFQPDLTPFLEKIELCSKTPFQKRVLTALCQVPPGRYTTYGALASHLNSAPRAVGNALRNNPFAPEVPCHRVLATGGGLGGFMGSWGRQGEEGKNDAKKLELLRGEGVKFDGKGKVVGAVWDGFV